MSEMIDAQRLATDILGSLTDDLGVQIGDERVDDHLFRGPHGGLEHLSYSERLDQWTRGLYRRDETFRNRLVRAIKDGPEFDGWCYVRRIELGQPEPVVLEISRTVECTLCSKRFPSENAFGWHLADSHETATDEKMQYAVEVPENQARLNEWGGGSV